MIRLDRLVYKLKLKFPELYRVIETLGGCMTVLRYRGPLRLVEEENRIIGMVLGKKAEMRLIGPEDTYALREMIAGIPKEHLKFFSPHGMDEKSIHHVLKRRNFLTYGLFIEGRMKAYALLKLFPTGKTYIGRLILPELTGLGLGKFLSRYLYWQAHLLGFQPCSTIHNDNIASLRSHESVRPFTVGARLPGGFNLIEFQISEEDKNKPELLIEEGKKR